MFEVNGVKIGQGHKPYIIAELSANHGGRIERAKDFLRKAEGTTCVFISHTANILEFAFEKLGITPDSVFQLGRNTVGRAMR